MRKRIWIPATLIAAAALGFFGFAPGYVEGAMNQIDGKPLIAVSDEAKALHKTLNIVDLHSDTLMWNRDLNNSVSRGHMDLPRLQEGNVALQLFSSVTKTPKNQNYDGNGADTDNITLLTIAQLQPVKTWSSLVERSLYHAQKRDAAVAGSSGAISAVDTAGQLDALLSARQKDKRAVGAMLTIEGLQNLEGKAANLDRLYDAGFRMAGLTHFFDNELAGSMHGLKKGGLTPFGRDIVKRMESKGMIIDIAHLSHTGVAEVLAMATRPVVSSHGGVQATCKVNRNLT
ncbi:MAG: membrane dipeptidase, partial [Sphingorhabdus sp.]|nr:membrane dipeptidase [Sphingorhabdus sp.]